MSAGRRWRAEGAPAEDSVRPHVLWLPPAEVIDYFRQVREVLGPYEDIVAPVADGDLHWTIQGALSHDYADERVGPRQLKDTAEALRVDLAEQEPFMIDIGPVALSRSAVLARVWPHDAPSNPPLHLNLRVRAGLANAGLVLPEATEPYFPHMSAAYGKVDTHYLSQMDRADALASALLRHARHHMTVRIKSVWLVMETQHPDLHTYTFERIQELPLGR
ncbi:2'-5' RNA ligase family protein [Streptomyces sp. NPDC051913]|uniref:2'-5' RNA ligase family protein n=1 Tax=Streptomyces sp. NPDC051913 TaxID=3365676 RepID=UPI0037D421D3